MPIHTRSLTMGGVRHSIHPKGIHRHEPMGQAWSRRPLTPYETATNPIRLILLNRRPIKGTQKVGFPVAQYTGKVAWFNNAKGFGFLKHDGGPDVFCHYTAIQTEGYKSLKEDDPVEFDIEQGEKGPQAANVIRLNSAPPEPAA